MQRIADRLAAGLVYFALGAAILTFLVTRNLTATIAVIVVLELAELRQVPER